MTARPQRGALGLAIAGALFAWLASGCGERPSASRAKADHRRAADPMAESALLADVHALCSPRLAGRDSFGDGGRLAADWVADQLSALGLEIRRQRVPGGAVNVFAIRRASGRVATRAVVVSAHYDHLGPATGGGYYAGADDNASGVAVLLAIARATASRPLRRTIVFAAFGAEEVGLVGSGHYMTAPLWPLERTDAVINFDMVGRRFFEAGVNSDRTAAIVGLEADPAIRRAALAAADRAGLRVVDTPVSLLSIFRLHARTDDWWFRRAGVPAIHFSTGMHADYHRTTDTPDKLVPAQMRRIATTAAGLLEFLANR